MADANVAERLRGMQQRMNPDAIPVQLDEARGGQQLEDVAPRTKGVMDEQFPTNRLRAYDKLDREMEARMQLGDEKGMTPFGQMKLEPKHLKWLQKKQAASEAANFQAWFAKEFDHMSPADKKRARELYPEFYAQRKTLLKQQAKNLQNLARIKLTGAESFKDLLTVYAAETGRLDVGPLEHLLNPEKAQGSAAWQQAKFRRGLLNPFRVFGKEALDNRGEQNVAQRRVTANQFAQRQYGPQAQDYGVDGYGFPPMSVAGTDTNQNTEDWYKMLKSGPA